ncbi:hypothetical protein HPB48_003213 [Haemaphysalis longicornis]|uniref:Ankyrin repeat domain-containing protein 54 n=1 Tax=Haemaphysalis longicornis TaxID=44386 RepID=A0A9J6FRG4_HAELO|nr:hypothetical protein HPB48_003213 [Haemaphysalis longicornis]
MSGTDSGIDTGSESNGSTSMSVGSPPRQNADHEQADPQDEDAAEPVFFSSVAPLAVQCLSAMAVEPTESLCRSAADDEKFSTRPWLGKMRMQHRRLHRWRFLSGLCSRTRDIVTVCTSHTEVITQLLKAGTDVNSLDNSGRTPLHLAQSKLRLLKVDMSKSSENVKQEVIKVIEMLQVYLQRSGKPAESDLLGAFSTRLRLHQTRQEVDNDVQDLLSSLAHLSLHKT